MIFNGDRNAGPFDEIKARYREQWIGPVSFDWHDLAFEFLGRDSVIVTGEFDWDAPGAIERYPYCGVLQRTAMILRSITRHARDQNWSPSGWTS